MILIDRSEVEQDIVLTLDEIFSNSMLMLKHDSTRAEFEIPLGDNKSAFPERFDLFRVATELFDPLPDGYYSYKIKQMPPYAEVVVETGKLFIKPDAPEEVTFAKESDDDYLVYTPK